MSEPVTLYAAEAGAGFPLLLLHGNGESSAYFSSQIPFFAAHYHVYAVDTRGHGQSPRGTAPFTLDQFAEDLAAFLDARGINKAHILGFSDGGNIALLFALRHPERVEKLVLNGANLSPSGVRPAVQLPITAAYGIASCLSRISKRANAQKELLGLMVNEPHISFASLAALTMPVLVVAGTRDMIRESHTRRIAAALPNAELRFLTGDHFVAWKRSDAFNAAVGSFLAPSGGEHPVLQEETDVTHNTDNPENPADVARATELLHSSGDTCVLVRGDAVYRSDQRGVKFLMRLIGEGTDLSGFSVADKVVGKATAMLFVYSGVVSVHADVIGKKAEEMLARYHVPFTFDVQTDHIINRAGTGLCPMEQAVLELDDPALAPPAIRETLLRLQQGH